ncbi:MAG: toxin-antitoxin system YwqK family antitoxin, partial [Myxococcota bacterium]
PDVQRQGLWEWFHFGGGLRARGKFLDGRRNGHWVLYDEAGSTLQETQWQSGVVRSRRWLVECPETARWVGDVYPMGRARFCKRPDPNGRLRNDGPWVSWQETGEIEAIGFVADHRSHGVFSMWHPTGAKKSETRFVNGSKEGESLSWHPRGQLAIIATYKNNQEDGRWVSWFSNGNPQSRGTFRAGKEHGDWEFWYSTGQMAQRGRFENGKPVGRWQEWDPDGALVKDEVKP